MFLRYYLLLIVIWNPMLNTRWVGYEKEEVLCMVFHRSTKEAPEITLTYYTYDGNYDSVAVNGTERYLVKNADVNALVQQIAEAFK